MKNKTKLNKQQQQQQPSLQERLISTYIECNQVFESETKFPQLLLHVLSSVNFICNGNGIENVYPMMLYIFSAVRKSHMNHTLIQSVSAHYFRFIKLVLKKKHQRFKVFRVSNKTRCIIRLKRPEIKKLLVYHLLHAM